MLKKLFILTIVTSLIATQANARWANFEDATLETEINNMDIKVNLDGSSEIVSENRTHILKEQGRQEVASLPIYYNGDNEELHILAAKTINGKKEYIVTDKMMENKPLASAPSGFDQKRQLLISFPNVEVGSRIYLKYKFVKKRAEFDNFFSKMIVFGENSYLKNSVVTLNSKIPLNLIVNDPTKILKITKNKDADFTSLKVELTKPIYNARVSEMENSYLNIAHLTWASVSSLTKWEDLSKKMAPNYEKVLKQKLPKEFEEIKLAAEKEKGEVAQINKVTSMLNDKVRYMGDWSSVKGRILPHSLDEIVAMQVADCKDFSVSTGAILINLGFKVNVAWVLRGENLQSYEGILPEGGSFNHAIIKVTGKNGKVYWVDPTNDISMADGIFPDINGKKTLVLDSKEGSYEQIDNINSAHAQSTITKELEVTNDLVKYKGTVKLEGEKAISLSAASLFVSDQHLKDQLFYGLSGVHLDAEDKLELILPDLKSRTVSEIFISYAFQQKNAVIKSNLGPAIRLKSSTADDITNSAPDQVADIYIGMPRTENFHQIIKNIKVKNISDLNYEIDTDWVSIKRSCFYNGSDTEIKDVVIVKQSYIPAEEIRKPAYKKLKSELEKSFSDVMIVL